MRRCGGRAFQMRLRRAERILRSYWVATTCRPHGAAAIAHAYTLQKVESVRPMQGSAL
jgi:hypothetical protein